MTSKRKVRILVDNDWTSDIPDCEHVSFFRSTDWAATPMGRLEEWGPILRIYIYQLMTDSRPACLYWGPSKIAIYNEAFVPLAGAAHPVLMGQGFRDIFGVIWDNMRPVFELAESSGRAADVLEMPLMVERNNFLEETVFTGNFNPLRGDSGQIEGFYNALFEVTKAKIAERRTKMLNLIGSPQPFHTTTTIGGHVIKCLETNARDVPAAILYKLDEEAIPGKIMARIVGSIGLPEEHILRQESSLDGKSELLRLLRKADAGSFTVEVPPEFRGLVWQGFGEASKQISVIPCGNGRSTWGYLVAGTNPRRPSDDDHRQFIADIARQISTVVSAVQNKQEIEERQMRLEKELADSERKITYMAKHAQVAMTHVALDGIIIWANEAYYAMMDVPDEQGVPINALEVPLPEDDTHVNEVWLKLLDGEAVHDREIRIKRLFVPPVGDPEPATMLCSAFPYFEDGNVVSVMSCMIDVSSLKWAERWQARSAEEAIKAKKEQDEFVDSISHEIRNPLSAIFQLADSISTSLGSLQAGVPIAEEVLLVVNENAEAAKTILLCASHQKKIVDDVLTLSRLNFMLLSLTPSPIRPSEFVSRIAQMFKADLQSNGIKLTVTGENAHAPSDVDFVLCDPSRVTQVLINLLTNSIKFTKERPIKRIAIKYGITSKVPWEAHSERMYWLPKQDLLTQEDVTLLPDWGSGQHYYLNFAVEDTGVGMKDEEMKKLFGRFRQANFRTQIDYGGSGLGLHVSQKLVEKQGGNVGVMSTFGQGSTFAFYIKVRRTVTPVPALASSIASIGNESELNSQFLQIPHRPSPIGQPLSKTAEPLYVLLVEDNIVNQQILKRQLVKSGCVVYVANHGLEALTVLKTTVHWHDRPESGQPLDIILMDWEMPQMNGLECSREIRRLQKEGKILKHIDIIATTANSRKEQLDVALKAGMDEVVPKPFVVGELMAKIKARLGRV